MPGFCWLNCLTSAVLSPEVSLPMQSVTLPLALFIDLTSMTLAPLTWADPVDPLPPPPPLLLLPQAAARTPVARTAPAVVRNRLDTELPLLCFSARRRRAPAPEGVERRPHYLAGQRDAPTVVTLTACARLPGMRFA